MRFPKIPGSPKRPSIFDYPRKKIVQGWSLDRPFGWPIFAEAGKTRCGFGTYGRSMPYPTCWDIDSGKKIAEFKGSRGGDPASVSTHASRIILTHIRNYFGLDQEFDMHRTRTVSFGISARTSRSPSGFLSVRSARQV